MKKIVFLILFLTGLFPVFDNDGLYLESGKVYGQEDPYGNEVVMCNDPDRVTTEDMGDYYLVETCISVNEDGDSTKDCVWECSTDFQDKPDPDPDPDSCDQSNPNYDPIACNESNCNTTCSTGFVLDQYCNCNEVPQQCYNTCPEGYYQTPDCGCASIPNSNPPGTCTLVACSTSGYVVDRNLCKCVLSKNDPDSTPDPCAGKISKNYLLNVADENNVLAGNILAVYNVETGGQAFTSDGTPKVLFERHHFSKLTNHIYDNSNPNISGPKRVRYGSYSDNLIYLKEAFALNPVAAIKSASFGAFQILGSNYQLAGYSNMDDFYNDMISTNADTHLEAFIQYVINRGILDDLQNENWDGFAKGYNGQYYNSPGSASKDYDKKMKSESDKYKNNSDLINNEDCF